jgi:hypothetical protein
MPMFRQVTCQRERLAPSFLPGRKRNSSHDFMIAKFEANNKNYYFDNNSAIEDYNTLIISTNFAVSQD